MKKSEALKRVPISPVELTVDEAMQYLPLELDLSKDENRKKIRDWMVRICGVVTQRNVDAFTIATKNAIDEAGALAIDPHYYQRLARRRESRKAQKVAARQLARMSREQQAFESIKESKVVM